VTSPQTRLKDRVASLALLPIVVLAGLMLIVFSPVVTGYAWLYRLYLRLRFEHRWGRQGRRALLVYSRSPNWQSHIEERWLSEIGSQLVTLDWSDRARPTWRRSLEARIFLAWAPSRNFNPIAILFPQGERPRVLLFRDACLEHKPASPGLLQASKRSSSRLCAKAADAGGLGVILCVVMGFLAAIVVAVSSQSSITLPETLRAHVKSERFQIVASIKGLPLGVRNNLEKLFGGYTLDIADPGAEFQGSAGAADPRLPLRRLVAAGCSMDHCLVYYERNGNPRTWHVALFHWTPDETRFESGGIAPRGLVSTNDVRKALLSGAIKGPAKVW
jgi:hypothetical protein